MICHLVKPQPFCGRDYLWVTDQRNREAADRQFRKNLARPEGLEPPTYRFEVAPEAQLQGLTEKSRSVLQIIGSLDSLSIPALPYHYGNELETNLS